MKRTQLYLEDNIWKLLHILARQSGSSVSELVRRAVREKYLHAAKNRGEVFQAVVGLWKDHMDLPETESYVRNLRKDSRSRRLAS